jgi:hypothetical protein
MEAPLPRTGGVYSPPAGTKGVPNTTIQSVPYNALIDDLTADANVARPITAGGTGATSASGARTALGAQATHAALTSISGLATSADRMIYTTAADAYATTALTPFARTLLDDATAAAALTTLGVSTFMQTVLDDADAATARTTLGANNASNLTAGTVPDARIAGAYTGITTLTATDTVTAPRLRLTSTADASESSTAHALQIGDTAGQNLIIDNNEIMVRSNGVLNSLFIPGGVSFNSDKALAVTDGGTGATTTAQAQTNLGVPPTSRTITAGNGLTGGGDLSANRTLTLGTPSDITNSTTNSLTSTSHTHALGFIAAEVSTTTSASTTSFPLGHMVCMRKSGGSTLSRNGTEGVCISSTDSSFYVNAAHGSAGTQLSGTWRSRGGGDDAASSTDFFIMQRIA